jgi:hypothetical protein
MADHESSIGDELRQRIADRAALEARELARMREVEAYDERQRALAEGRMSAHEVRRRVVDTVRGYAVETASALLSLGYEPTVVVREPQLEKQVGAAALLGSLRGRRRLADDDGIGDRRIWYVETPRGEITRDIPSATNRSKGRKVRIGSRGIGLDKTGGLLLVNRWEREGWSKTVSVVDPDIWADGPGGLQYKSVTSTSSVLSASVRLEHEGHFATDEDIFQPHSDRAPGPRGPTFSLKDYPMADDFDPNDHPVAKFWRQALTGIDPQW